MGNEMCNTKDFRDHVFVVCEEPAIWEHPRYPDGAFCDKHKESVAAFFPNDWTIIKESKDGK